MKENRIEIIINWYKIIIEKGEIIQDDPNKLNLPIQYNPIDIKRKYYKKTDKEYHRKPLKGSTKFSKFLKSDKIVTQEPLLDLNY